MQQVYPQKQQLIRSFKIPKIRLCLADILGLTEIFHPQQGLATEIAAVEVDLKHAPFLSFHDPRRPIAKDNSVLKHNIFPPRKAPLFP